MKSKNIVFLAAVTLLLRLGGAQPASGPVKTAGEELKNVHVLADVPMSEWNATMRFITEALGVSCDHCHTGQAYQKDDRKSKQMARNMIQMTREMNSKNFGGRLEVTCFTCHQGSTQPKQSPVLWNKTPEELAAIKKQQQKKPDAPAASESSTSLPDAEQVLAKYRQAVGGETVRTIRMKAAGTLETRPPFDIDVEIAMPDKVLIHAIIGGQDVRQVVNGKQGWTVVQGRSIEMPTSNVDGLRKQIDLFSPLKVSQSDPSRKTSGVEKIGDRSFAVLESRTDVRRERLYFDMQTGLLYKQYSEAHTPLGDSPSEIVFDDYRDVAGVKLPFQMVVRSPEERSRFTFSGVEINKPVDAAGFQRPVVSGGGK